MSVLSSGIPLNLGLTHGLKTDSSWSLLANCCPDIITLQYSKPIEFPNIQTLGEFTLSNNAQSLYPGYSVLVHDTDLTTRKEQTCEYMWNKYRWAKIGSPNITEYVNIYNMIQSTSNTESDWYADFFMRVHTKNIKSNVSLLSLLDRKVALRASDFISYCGISGNFDMNISTDNVLFRLLRLNIIGGVNCLMQKLCSEYKVDQITFTDLQNSLITSIRSILQETAYNFISLKDDYTTLDFSMYVNYIGCCFASFKWILLNHYNDKILPTKIDPTTMLSIIDQIFLNKLNSSKSLRNDIEELLDDIDRILYSDSSNSTFYGVLLSVSEYFKTNNSNIFKYSSTKNTFITKLCEGVGGIVTLALFLSIISNGDETSKNTIFLQILNEELWRDVR